MRILTVDDSATTRLIIKRTFEGDGHQVWEAPDGAVALNLLETQSPIDVVFMDWNMPVMDGLECLQEIRKNAAYENVRVIMCTTEAEKTSVVKAIKAGANGYQLKPVSPDALREQLGKVARVAPSEQPVEKVDSPP